MKCTLIIKKNVKEKLRNQAGLVVFVLYNPTKTVPWYQLLY